MSDKREKFARFGIATKGVVYILIGGLTAMTALGMGGKQTGSSGALEYLAKQSYGQVLLSLVAFGLVGYVFWRFYQVFADSENNGTDAKGIIKRIAYFFSGVFYAFLAYSAIKIITDAGSSSGGNSWSAIFQSTAGKILLVLVALGLLGKAIYQLYQAYSGGFRDKIKEAGLDRKAQKLLVRSGQIGFTARAIVIGITVYLIFKGIISEGSTDMAGKKQAFEFLKGTFGNTVLIVTALGLVAYGVFMCIKARYASKLINA